MFSPFRPAQPSVWNFYKHLYDIWLDTTSEMLQKAMRTPAFATTMGRSVEQSLDFKRHMEEVLEAWLKSARFATDADVQTALLALKRLEDKITHMESSRAEAIERPAAFGGDAGRNLAQPMDDLRRYVEEAIDNRLARMESSLEGRLSQAIARIESNGLLAQEVAELLRLTLAEVSAAKKANQPANQMMMDQPASFANLAKALVQSSDFKIQIEEALVDGLQSMNLARNPDVQAVVRAVEAVEAKTAQTTSAIGAFAANLGKTIDQLRQAEENTTAWLATQFEALEPDVKAMRAEIKASKEHFETTLSLVRVMVGSFDDIAKQLALITPKGPSRT